MSEDFCRQCRVRLSEADTVPCGWSECPLHKTEPPQVAVAPCQSCDGNGVVMTGTARVWDWGCGFSRIEGIEEECGACDGTGWEPVEAESLSLEDLMEMAGVPGLEPGLQGFGDPPTCQYLTPP